MPFSPEPSYTHGQAPRTAVLLCNLGTPDEPTPKAVRRYLAEFLSDHRVVEIPRLLWLLILHGIILRFRPAKSAAKYASIWTPEGSPLKIWTEKQAKLLQGWLGQRNHQVKVRGFRVEPGAIPLFPPGAPAVSAAVTLGAREGSTRSSTPGPDGRPGPE